MLPPPDTQAYGIAFAERVAHALQSGGSVYYRHRDYCGMGLWFEQECFCYDEIYDCGPHPLEEVKANGPARGGHVFETRHAFVGWLAQQSDHSLAGFEHENPFWHENQRITRARLQEELGC